MAYKFALAGVLGLIPTMLLAAQGCGTRSTPETASDSNLTMQELPVLFSSMTPGLFTQEIDHPQDRGPSIGTFTQRYWYSTQYASGPSAPVLFYICGEAECSPEEVGAFGDSAKALGAAVVGLEHRYYGQSLPYQDLSLANMKYLTIHNALEDLAAFAVWAKAQPNLGLSGKWISIGGSYPGMLSAFFREKHPELVVGAWASSAPVNDQVSFWGYDAIASRSLGDECTGLIQTAFTQFDAAFTDPTKHQLVDPNGEHTWLWQYDKGTLDSSLSGDAMSSAQYNRGAEDHVLCSALKQHPGNPALGYVEYIDSPLVPDPPTTDDDGGPADGDAGPSADQDGGGAPAPRHFPVSHETGTVSVGSRIPIIQRPDATGDFAGAEWFYQVCTEVGFYQVANPDRAHSIMAADANVSASDAICMQAVGTTPNVQQTRLDYYEPLLSGSVTNILFVNGSLDPWSALGFPADHPNAPSLVSLTVADGSHCTDLSPLKPQGTLVGDFIAHKQFHDLAVTWLAQ